MRTYNLDPVAASQAGVSNYITETGKYKGKFTRAEIVESKQGTEGVEFTFESSEGLKADYLQLWTYNRDGKALPSLKALNAIMACLRTREMQPTQATISDAKGTRTAQVFPMLTNKPIGVLLQREEYVKGDGGIGYKFNLVAPFEAQTELTAAEILAKKTQPEQLAKMVSMLKDKPMQNARPAKSDNGFQHGDPGASFADAEDSIPF